MRDEIQSHLKRIAGSGVHGAVRFRKVSPALEEIKLPDEVVMQERLLSLPLYAAAQLDDFLNGSV